MASIQKTLKDISRQRRVEKEFASEAERRVVERKIDDKKLALIKANDFEELP